MTRELDVITIGRASVDLYGAQVGGRLEDMGSFHKYIGGSPANMACGMARLGLKSALITRVGDEHMGRFILEQLAREGVDTGGVVTDRGRLTALAILGIRDQARFPLLFYRENCADMALCEGDIDEGFIAFGAWCLRGQRARTLSHASDAAPAVPQGVASPAGTGCVPCSTSDLIRPNPVGVSCCAIGGRCEMFRYAENRGCSLPIRQSDTVISSTLIGGAGRRISTFAGGLFHPEPLAVPFLKAVFRSVSPQRSYASARPLGRFGLEGSDFRQPSWRPLGSGSSRSRSSMFPGAGRPLWRD